MKNFYIKEDKICSRITGNYIERPSILYDADGYVLLKIGSFELCENTCEIYKNKVAKIGKEQVFSKLSIFEFDSNLDTMTVCIHMNKALDTVGYLKGLVT